MSDESYGITILAEANDDGNNIEVNIRVPVTAPEGGGWPRPEEIATQVNLLVGALADLGFKRRIAAERSFKGGGKGGQRQETPPPADLADRVPKHCGEPMVYKEAFTNPKNGNQVGAKFVCRKDKQCSAVTEDGGQWPASKFEDAYRKWLSQQEAGA